MDKKEVSEELFQKSGYVFNINLPDWKSPNTTPPEVIEKNKKMNQLYIAGGILLAIIIGIVLMSKKRK